MNIYRVDKPFILTIFGASGDLAKLKLFPALQSLMEQKRFPKEFYIVGYARTKKDEKAFQKEFAHSVEKHFGKDLNRKALAQLLDHVHYFTGQYNKKSDFETYRTYLQKLTKAHKLTHLAYFSIPPIAFKDVIKNLGETKAQKNEDLRLIIEKPFGEDTKSARDLFHFVARYFPEDQIYLLDHYLGKTAVQSILSLRHSNRLLNLMTKGPEVSNIQITAHESIGVTNRVGYFDKVGTIKDMVQSHLMQLLALVAMSIPISENNESLHREKQNILSALKFVESKNNLVLGQYESYKKEKDVLKDSSTETYAALRLFIDRESWYNTPIYLRTGKKLDKKRTYIVVEIKKFAFQPKHEEPNRLIFELQPEEKISIRLVSKQGTTSRYQEIITSDSIACEGDDCLPEHGLLLLDVFRKNHLHFLSFQEIIATWQITDHISNFIKRSKPTLHTYKDFSQGPSDQHKLTKLDNFKWFEIDDKT